MHQQAYTTREDVTVDIFSTKIPGMPSLSDVDNLNMPSSSDIRLAESLIASHMAALSVEAREKAYMDMHGVPDVVKESSELIQQKLKELQYELDNIPGKDVYNLAWAADRKYVEDEEFRIPFLKSTEMNPKLAAYRIVRHFEFKLELFGPESLARAITQDDLTKDDMDALYSGRARFLTTRDRAGRIINLLITGQRYTTQACVSLRCGIV